MQQSAIDQLGLSPAAARVMKARLESSLAGPNSSHSSSDVARRHDLS